MLSLSQPANFISRIIKNKVYWSLKEKMHQVVLYEVYYFRAECEMVEHID